MTEIPDDLLCTTDHMWVRPGNGDRVRVGVTVTLLERRGMVDSLSLPEPGEEVVAGDTCGELEFESRTWEIVSPVSGEVVAVNPLVPEEPGLLESDPYGDGWLFAVAVPDMGQLDELLDPDAYLAQVGE